MQYMPITEDILQKIQSIVGASAVFSDPESMKPYSHDEVTDPVYHHMPEAVALPQTTEQVAALVRLANEYRFPIVPRGAGTGLACGAVPSLGGLVISLEKMNRIIEINEKSLYAIAEAGVRTEELQQEAAKRGLFYAGDPCSGDSCFIGGNIATNAGGNRAVKYGTTRHQVYELEVVSPTGEILHLGARLHKMTTGYALEQLIIGSEGTLGIVTRCTLRLLPKPQHVFDLLAVYPTLQQAVDTVEHLTLSGITPACIELMDSVTIQSVENFLGESLPGTGNRHYLIIQLDGNNEDQLDEEAVAIDELCTETGAIEVLTADSTKIWRARKAFAEAVRAESLIVCKEDIVVPVDQEPAILQTIFDLAAEHDLITRIAAHAGDGNIHLNIIKPQQMSHEDWTSMLQVFQQKLYTAIYSLGGRLSGEHGIGEKRKKLLAQFTGEAELNMMKAIKKSLDPNMILNPGKLFDIR